MFSCQKKKGYTFYDVTVLSIDSDYITVEVCDAPYHHEEMILWLSSFHTMDNIQVGDHVYVTISKQMTMSLPPQAQLLDIKKADEEKSMPRFP